MAGLGVMVCSLALVLTLLFLGEMAAQILFIPIPGAALGLAAMVALLAARDGPDPDLERLFDGIAPNAPLLFVPAATGIVANFDLLWRFFVPLVLAVVLGTATTLVVVGVCAQKLLDARRKAA